MRMNRKIILVEDNPADVELVKMSLKELALEVHLLHFFNGQELLDYLQTHATYDIVLILLDLNMPKMDGIGVLKAFKQEARLRCIPVVVFTSSSFSEDVDHCYELGANAYVCKPIDMNAFEKAIQAIIAFWMEINIIANFKRRVE